MTQPQAGDADRPQRTGRRPPEYVIETWVSEQLRNRIQRNGMSLAQALQVEDTLARAPQAELEAEP
jgi:hypothetical protein